MPDDFLSRCSSYQEAGYRFLGLQTNSSHVSYFFEGHGEVVTLNQEVEENTVASLAFLFPLADFAERQLYRDRQIKALGNINLMPREEIAHERPS